MRLGYLFPPAPSLPDCNGLAALPSTVKLLSNALSIALPSGLSKSLVPSGLGVARVGKTPCSKHS